MGPFKSMETAGTISVQQKEALPNFCSAMCASLAELVQQISPPVAPRDVAELPLLTLGAQFQGANNVTIGKQATVDVFLAIADLVKHHLTSRSDRDLELINSSGRTVIIALSSDPDVRIQEDFAGAIHKKVAVEIKGGADLSNVHNRAGEAEKSHQKAKADGFRDFWTIIARRGVSLVKLQEESPTTTSWFDLNEILSRDGDDWEEFKRRIVGEAGIPVKPI